MEGHVSRSSGLAKPIPQGTVTGEDDKADRGRGGKRTRQTEEELEKRQGRQRKRWEDDKADRGRGAKTTRQIEEEVRRQHQGMNRPGVRQVHEGMENREKLRKLVVKSSVVPQRPPWLRDR